MAGMPAMRHGRQAGRRELGGTACAWDRWTFALSSFQQHHQFPLTPPFTSAGVSPLAALALLPSIKLQWHFPCCAFGHFTGSISLSRPCMRSSAQALPPLHLPTPFLPTYGGGVLLLWEASGLRKIRRGGEEERRGHTQDGAEKAMHSISLLGATTKTWPDALMSDILLPSPS